MPREIVATRIVVLASLLLTGCAGSSPTSPAAGAAPTARPSASAAPPASTAAPTEPVNAACPDAPRCTKDCPALPKQIVAGNAHTCALSVAGEVTCWGDNAEGQLGDGTREPKAKPIKIASNAQGVAAGEGFTCLLEGGAVRCLGALRKPWLGPSVAEIERACNAGEGGKECALFVATRKMEAKVPKAALEAVRKEQADREEAERTTPRAVSPAIAGAVSIAASGFDVCTLDAAGKATCFIYTRPDAATASIYGRDRLAKPEVVAGVTDLVEVAPGMVASCGRTREGTVACWNRFGVAQKIPGVTGARSLGVSREEACVATADGHVSCWATRGDPKPTTRQGLSKIVELRGNTTTMCARAEEGAVTCWRAPAGDLDVAAAPRKIDGAGNATAITVGHDHACAITTDGVRCWGNTTRGALGDGGMAEVLAPIDVGLDAAAVDVSANQFTTCAVLADGRVRCWGHGYTPAGAVAGEGPASAVVEGVAGAERVFVGEGQACAIAKGAVSCWPHVGTPLPVEPVGGIDDAISVAPGTGVSCAATKKGETRCWWQGSEASVLPGVRDLVETSYGASDWSCGRTRAGKMTCWSMAMDDMPEDGWSKPKVSVIPGASGLTSVATSAFSSCGTRQDGKLMCTGGMTVKKALPRAGFEDVAQVALANATTLGAFLCARTRAGRVVCSGANASGELGTKTFTSPPWPNVAGPSDLDGVTDIAVGALHACALRANGKVACWGSDAVGQVSGTARGRRSCARPIDRR